MYIYIHHYISASYSRDANDVRNDLAARIHHGKLGMDPPSKICRAASSREWPKGLSFHNLGDLETSKWGRLMCKVVTLVA